MKRLFLFLNRLTCYWNLTATALLIPTIALFLLGMQQAQLLPKVGLWIWALVHGVVAVALLFKKPWARKIGIGLFLLLAGIKCVSLFSVGFSGRTLVHIFIPLSLALGLWKYPNECLFGANATDQDREKEDAEDKNENENENEGEGEVDGEDEAPLHSLVLFCREKRYLEPVVLANALSQAWGVHLKAVANSDELDMQEGGDGFVLDSGPFYVVMLRRPRAALAFVHNMDTPYVSEERVNELELPNVRFHKVLAEHGAWLAVDVSRITGKDLAEQEAFAYQLIGKAIAALADEDSALGIYCPPIKSFNLWSPTLEDTLCGQQPLEIFKQEVGGVTHAPIMGKSRRPE